MAGHDEETTGEQPANSEKRNPAEHLKPHQFKKGTSGNPSGRPKGTLSLTNLLRKRLMEIAEDANGKPTGKTIAEVIVEAATEAASKGDHNFFRDIFNRIDGKPVQRMEIKVSELAEQSEAELREIIEAEGEAAPDENDHDQ